MDRKYMMLAVFGRSEGIEGIFRVKAAVLALFAFSLVAVSAVPAAEAPVWSSGFPKLAEKNALLQWNPVKGAAEYKVYRTEAKDKDLKLIATVKLNRHIDKDLPGDRLFFYYVSAVVDGTEGPRSSAADLKTIKEKVFVPLKPPKLEPPHVKPVGNTGYLVGIRWEFGQGSELVGYNLYRSTQQGKGYTLIYSQAGDSYEDKDVKPGKTYYYVATSIDTGFNETKYSNEVSVKVPELEKAAPKKQKEASKPTKMRAAKFLFEIPIRDEDGETDDVVEARSQKKKDPVPANTQGVAVDEAAGQIYVTSYVYGGILVYDFKGKFLFGIRKDRINGDVKFAAAKGVALGPDGRLYFTDYSEATLRIYEPDGKLADTLEVDLSYIPNGGTARLYGIVVAPDGMFYVSIPSSNRILAYSPSKKRLFDIANDKKKNIEMNGPSFMALDRNGDLFIVDSGFSRLQSFSRDGKLKKVIGKKGNGPGMLHYPTGLARGNGGEIFSASGVTPNIQAFSEDGKFLYALSNDTHDGPLPVADMRGIYVDSKDRLYVAQGLMNKVSVFQLLDDYYEITPK